MKMSSNCHYFLLLLAFLECFMSITSSHDVFLSLSLFFSLFLQFTSFESSLLFTPYKLEIESYLLSALARQWSFAGAPVFRFQFVRFKLLRDGAGIRSCALPKECCTFFPKTMVSWPKVIDCMLNLSMLLGK